VPVPPAATRKAHINGGRRRFAIPEGWVARGWRFEVEPTTPHQRSAIAQHFGARRFAYNWALARVKANLDARAADPTVPALAWNIPTIRRDWNQAKHQVAPWWRQCSKEAYACGIADLVAALHNWAVQLMPNMAAAAASGWGSRGSRPDTVTAAGSASAPARCA
jgi:hypothetical protein